MSQLADITVFDGAATPVSHTLKGMSVTRNKANEIVAEYREAIPSLPVIAQVRASIKYSMLKSGVVKTEVRVVVPVMETVGAQNAAGYTAQPKVAYEDTVVIQGYFHPRSTITGRRLVRQLAVNLGGNISTSVAPVAAGPVPELFDLLMCPV